MSSIMEEPPETFKVFIALLAACGPDGIASVSETYLVSICRLPAPVVARAIRKLSFPDPKSRTMTDQGRRIRRVDGGFFIINYEKFRKRTYSMMPAAIRQRKHRETKKKIQFSGQEIIPSLTEAEAEAEMFTNVTQCHRVSPKAGVYFDGSAWSGLTPDVLASLSLKFPISDIPGEIEKMATWIKAEPSRNNPEDDRTEFIERWLKRPSKVTKWPPTKRLARCREMEDAERKRTAEGSQDKEEVKP